MKLALALLAFLLLWTGTAQAGTYYLVRNATGTFTTPGTGAGQSTVIQTATGGPISSISAQVVATTSCTANLFGSNDNVNWVAVSAASDLQTPGSGNAPGTGFVTNGKSYVASWAYWAGTVSAVSGSCSLIVSG